MMQSRGTLVKMRAGRCSTSFTRINLFLCPSPASEYVLDNDSIGWWVVFATLGLIPVCVGVALLSLARWARHRNSELKSAYADAHPGMDSDKWMRELTTRSVEGFLVGSLSKVESVLGVAIACIAVVLVLLLLGTVLWMILSA